MGKDLKKKKKMEKERKPLGRKRRRKRNNCEEGIIELGNFEDSENLKN